MKKIIQYLIVLSLLLMVGLTAAIHAEPDLIGIGNVIDGELKSGTFEIRGVIQNNGSIGRVAVKTGQGPWEEACGIGSWSYQVNTRNIVLSYTEPLDPETAIRGAYYGDLIIKIGAFDANNQQVAEKTLHVTIIPEKPYSDIVSGEYKESLNVIFKAAPEVTTYYTIDGTDPKVNGTTYTGAIFVSQNTIIKAVSCVRAPLSNTDQYSETTTLDLKINPATPPRFKIQYYEDQAMSCPVADPAYLRAGTYYLKVIGDRKYSAGPWINIDAPGNGNDVIDAVVVPVSDCVYQYTRIINNDYAATGDSQEAIKISGTDNSGNLVSDLAPINSTLKAAYPDTQPPSAGSIALAGGISLTNDPTPQLEITSAGAAWMRLALSEAGLSFAPWIEYAAQYAEFDISGGGNGSKTIWIEFKDQAGNLQSQPVSTSVYYDDTVLSFDIQYYRDPGLTQTLGNTPYLKEGMYYLKISANQDLAYHPSLQIDAEGTANDVNYGATVAINPRIYYYTRTIVADSAAVGEVKEQIALQGINPSNVDTKAAYTDTLAPNAPIVTGLASTIGVKPSWSWNLVAGANKYRYSFIEGANWIETTGTTFNPDTNLTTGNSYTLYVQAGDRAGNWSPSGSFTTMVLTAPEMNLMQGTVGIPSGGSYSFGEVPVFSFGSASFTVKNVGNGILNLTGAPIVQISGADAACFSVTTPPATSVEAGGSATFALKFVPHQPGTKTAIVSISDNDLQRNPYTFTISGTGTVETMTIGSWTQGNIGAVGEVRTYSFNAMIGQRYAITWGQKYYRPEYTGQIKVTAYRQDLSTTYFTNEYAGFDNPKTIIAQDNVVYLKVVGLYTDSVGSFAIKAYSPGAKINVKQGTTGLPNGTGSYDFGDMLTNHSSAPVTFTIENLGTADLNFPASPVIQLSGANSSSFNVSAQPVSPVAPGGSATFAINFDPYNPGPKSAQVKIVSDDPDKTPYYFTVTGNGTFIPLTLNTWTQGDFSYSGEYKTYAFNTVVGQRYGITWDDNYEGSGSYSGNIFVSAFKKNYWDPSYFGSEYKGYLNPRTFIAVDDIVYISVCCYGSPSPAGFALKAFLDESEIDLKQGTTSIPSGTGSYDFGDVSLLTSKKSVFTIQNSGTGYLKLTATPVIQISGPNASSFSVTSQATTPVWPGGNANFEITYSPTGVGIQTASVSIPSSDPDENPYTFTITGNGNLESLPPNSWTPGSINPGEGKTYLFNTVVGQRYGIVWDDAKSGSGTYTGDVKISAFRQDMTTAYFSNIDSGYSSAQYITAQDNIVYVKIVGYSTTSTGSFALKAAPDEAEINIKQGSAAIANGTGGYNFGEVSVGALKYVTFTIENNGVHSLNLTGSPSLQISGPDAASFSLTATPSPFVNPNGKTTIEIRFAPTTTGAKLATMSIASNDADQSPYTFTISGNAIEAEIIPAETWTSGNITVREAKAYRFNAETGKTYAVAWDDSGQGSGAYTCNVNVSAYHQDLMTTYFSNVDSGYTAPRYFTAQEDVVYLRVSGASTSAAGGFALKVYEVAPKPLMNVKQGTTNLPNGTGNFNFGNVNLGYNWTVSFTVENTGSIDLNLNGAPQIQINGPDAACFMVTANPAATIAPYGTTSFLIQFTPSASGIKTATVSIANNDSQRNPYTFTLTGTGAVSPLNTWITGYLATATQTQMYSFETTPGSTYAVTWDDHFNGSGSYNGDIVVSAYRKNLTTAYFSYIYSGYSSPQVFTAQENCVIIKVGCYASHSSSIGSYRLKVYLQKPSISIKQGTTDLPNGTGRYDFGNTSLSAPVSASFTISNSGNGNLTLAGAPMVCISGTDAACFSVTSNPYSPVYVNGTTSFQIKFASKTPGIKTAMVSIASNDPDRTPYTFTITGTVTGTLETMPLETWTSGSLTNAGEEKYYAISVNVGKTYAITWDDSYQGSATYTGNIKVSAYYQNLTSAYFTNVDSAYTNPWPIVAADDVIYLKVAGYSSETTGSFALKAYLTEPEMVVKQGGNVIPNMGKYDYGAVQFTTYVCQTFNIYNTGNRTLILADGVPEITGPGAASFFITATPSNVAPGGSTFITVGFRSSSAETKTATIRIPSNDPNNNPFAFTVTGSGTGVIVPIDLDTWTPGSIDSQGIPGQPSDGKDFKLYALNTTPGTTYAVTWDDRGTADPGTENYTANVLVSTFHSDLTQTYFDQSSDGDTIYQTFTAQEEIVYLKAQGWYSTGTYAMKVFIPSAEARMNVYRGHDLISSGTGSYDFGKTQLCTSRSVDLRVENAGMAFLNLTGTPLVQISGPDADCFTVTTSPPRIFGGCERYLLNVQFKPTSSGAKTAILSIFSDDAAGSPYTISLTGMGEVESLPFNTWTPGEITAGGEEKTYSFQTIPGKSYGINWDDDMGSGTYTAFVKVTAYCQDVTTTYFSNVSSGYEDVLTRYITAQDNVVYLKVAGINSSITGSFALKVFLNEPVISLKQGTTSISNGGNFDFGNTALCAGNYATFTIENSGFGKLNLPGTPKVQISGPDADCFSVSADPTATINPNGNGTFILRCAPKGPGLKTASVCIQNNDPVANPFTFTVTGTGTVAGTLALDTWKVGNLASGEYQTYSFNATPGRTYAIMWDEQSIGSGAYTADIKVSAYQHDLTTTYFYAWDYGYNAYQGVITARDSTVYVVVGGSNSSSSGSFALKAYIYEPVMTLKQGNANISYVNGIYDFGNVSLCTGKDAAFTLGNSGNAFLHFYGNPMVQLSGPDASCFSVVSQPSGGTLMPGWGDGFTIRFNPTSPGTKRANVSIPNDDRDQDPYTFTVTGTGTGVISPLSLECRTTGSIATGGAVQLYSFTATPGTPYAITWDDSDNGGGTCNVVVSAYREDLLTTYFNDISVGSYPQIITAQGNIVYLKVIGNTSSVTGSFAVKVSLSEPELRVKFRNTTEILNGAWSYYFGPVSVGSSQDEHGFTLENHGDGYLHLPDSPSVQITGADAASFRVSYQPYSPIYPGGESSIYLQFNPVSVGMKTATVSIANDDPGQNPFTFTVTGYGAPVIEKALTLGSWTEGNIATPAAEAYFKFDAWAGRNYFIFWDDSNQGTGVYSGDVQLSAYRSDWLTPYVTDVTNGYTTPQIVTAQDSVVILKVSGSNASTGSFALKVVESAINLKQGSANIPCGSGSYDYGSVSFGSNRPVTFTIQNNGSGNLNLTGSPKIQISGPGASYFNVTSQPAASIAAGDFTSFTVTFTPSGVGTKTATISITSDAAYFNPYTFTITGTLAAQDLTPGAWTPGNISSGAVKTYYFQATPGSIYTVTWDDSYQGSGNYYCDIMVSAFRQDYSTGYFSNVNSGYTYPQVIMAQDGIVYLKVAGYNSSSSGSFGLKVTPVATVVKQGSTYLLNGSGSYSFSNVAFGGGSSGAFSIQNSGNANLNLTDTPKVRITGTDASSFSVTAQPASPITPGGSSSFTVTFTPSTPGTKTATINIATDDGTNNPYTFTVTGTGTAAGTPLTLGAWTSGQLYSSGEVQTFYFIATPGTSYSIGWDDSYQGSGGYNCDVKVSAYRQDLTTAYFSNADSGYTSPRIITAQDVVVYIKVDGYSSSYTGSFALKPSLLKPLISVKQGSALIPKDTGSYNYGNAAPGSSNSISFTIQNSGTGNLSLTGSPLVQISGSDAAMFSITTQPASPVAVGGTTTFTLRFAPTSLGIKTATLSIPSNDPDNSPYTFTVTGTGAYIGEEITLGSYLPKTIAVAGATNIYYFAATPGKTYKIYWDDSYQGSGTYTCDIKVSGLRGDLTTTYFSYTDSAYTTPQTITAQDGIVYLKMAGYYASSSGTFAIKVVEM